MLPRRSGQHSRHPSPFTARLALPSKPVDGLCLFVGYGQNDHGRTAIAQERKEAWRWPVDEEEVREKALDAEDAVEWAA